MKILVCISNVPDTTSKINFKNNDTDFDSSGIQYIINPNDEFGLTRAVWFQQKDDSDITVLTVGDSSCEPILRKCLAIGANRAVRINSKPIDAFQVAYEIAGFCKKEKLHYSLSAVEYAMKDSYKTLYQLISNLKHLDGIVAYSVFQLPLNNSERNRILKKIIKKKKTFYFALEDLKLSNKNDLSDYPDTPGD